MKAAWFEAFGNASEVIQIGEKSKPEAGPGEVLGPRLIACLY